MKHTNYTKKIRKIKHIQKTMGDLNEKNINYGALNRFYQDLKSHDLADLNYKIDNIDLSDVYNLIYTLHPNEDYLNFSANLPNTKVRLVLYSDYEAKPSTPIDIDYSFDRINWTHYTVGNDITIPTDGKVYLRGNNNYFSVYDYDNYDDILYYHHFEFENVSQDTLYVDAHGNINSLLLKTNYNEITTVPEYCYNKMFQSCTQLTTAPALPATTLVDYCYNFMFFGCTSLTTAPELPATTLAYYCYNCMFYGCTSLTTAPKLPATTLAEYCYSNMFQNCTSLTTAPALPATTLANGCYSYMFQGCTSLTNAPVLPTTTLPNGCYYQMFQGCTSLTTAPKLPATTLADYCYSYMFYGCTSLTTAPALPATTLASGCYSYMFYDCTSLTTAPALPATTLANYCYSYMFRGCSRLTTAPELPATTLANGCYSHMFSICTSLNSIKCLATNISARNCTTNWVKNVATTGTFVKAANMTGWTTGVNGIPSGWTVEDYTEPIIVDETTFTGVTLTVDGSQPSIVASGSTTIVWGELASSIPSGKTVEVSVVVVNTGNSALTPTMSGNYKMMGAGNITIQPLELGLYKAKYISEVNVWLVEAIHQEVSGTTE